MKGVCLLLLLATMATAQTFDETLPVLILVNTTQTAPDAQGQEVSTSDLERFGYDDASAGNDGWIFYRDSTSTDPAYDPILDPCSLTYNDTGCSPNADCIAYNSTIGVYQCACLTGYEDMSATAVDPSEEIMPGQTCENVDECADPVEACGEGVDQCFDLVGSHECNCTEGYTPNENATFCDDIDECAAGTDDCDVNANCTNTEGSHTCECNDGWSGDGITCDDIDECAEGTDDCDANAECSNTEGSFECTCNAGFSGDGVTCTDDDECADNTDTCDIDATCTNTDGSFTCACNEGYSGDGETCTDIDECAEGTDNCDANAECSNTDGSFTCTCNTGYSGDGETCSDVDECAEDPGPCHMNATCENTEASFECTCNEGFVGDGENTCLLAEPLEYCYRAILNVTGAVEADISEANSDTALREFLEQYTADSPDQTFFYSTVEVEMETFTDEGTHYSVIVSACFVNITKTADELTEIMDGFVGTHGVTFASGLTVEIGDYDECFHEYDECSDDATCSNTNGDYLCTCNAEFYDNSTEEDRAGTVCIDPYSYTCNGTYSTLTLLTEFFTGNNVNVSDIVVSEDCYGVEEGDNFVFYNCGGDDASNDTNIITAYHVLTNTSRLEWIASDIVNFTYHCVQENEQNLTVDFNATDDFVPVNVFDPASSVGIDINIKQFKNDFGLNSQLGSGSTIKTGDLACVELELVNAAESGVQVQFKKVDTSKPGSTNKLEILSEYCSTSKASQFGISTDSGIGDGKFCFTMHRPSSGFRLQVFFTVELCVGDSCTDFSCNNNRRRRRSSGDQTREEELSTVFVIDPDDQCNRDCQRGSCVLDFNRNEQCVCDDNAIKTDDGVCVGIIVEDDSSNIAANHNSADTSLFIVIGIAVGLLVVAFVVGAFFVARRNRYNYHGDQPYKN